MIIKIQKSHLDLIVDVFYKDRSANAECKINNLQALNFQQLR